MLLTVKEIDEQRREWLSHPLPRKFENLIKGSAKAQLKKVVEGIEKDIFYVDSRGYIALKPNASANWQALLKEIE